MNLSSENEEHRTTEALPAPSWRQKLLIWLALTLAIVPGMVAVMACQREVNLYHPLNFEEPARVALAKHEYARAAQLCTAVLRYPALSWDHVGRTYLLRAQARVGRGNPQKALEDLEAVAARWAEAPWFVEERDRAEILDFGAGLGSGFAGDAQPGEALRAFSAAGRGANRLVDYLYDLNERLDGSVKSVVWPDEPYLVVEDFGGPYAKGLSAWIDRSGRKLLAHGIDTVSYTGGSSAFGRVTGPTEEGECWIATPVRILLTARPFALRVWAFEEQPSDSELLIQYWFENAHMSAATKDAPAQDLGAGWELYDVRRDFYRERKAYADKVGYGVDDGEIIKVGLSVAGPANMFRLDRIDVYIPEPPGAEEGKSAA